MNKQLTVAVFGAASDSVSNRQKKKAYALGRLLRQYDCQIITGAGQTGIMGAVADGYHDVGRRYSTQFGCYVTQTHQVDQLIYGTTTDFLEDVEAPLHGDRCQLTVYKSMAERKAAYRKADIIIVLDGGVGTRDEFWDYLTQKKLSRLCGDRPELWDNHLVVLKGTGIARSIENDAKLMVTNGTADDINNYVRFFNLEQIEEFFFKSSMGEFYVERYKEDELYLVGSNLYSKGRSPFKKYGEAISLSLQEYPLGMTADRRVTIKCPKFPDYYSDFQDRVKTYVSLQKKHYDMKQVKLRNESSRRLLKAACDLAASRYNQPSSVFYRDETRKVRCVKCKTPCVYSVFFKHSCLKCNPI